MRLMVDDLEVLWPYDYIYPEQFAYMSKLYQALQSGHCLLEMPTGTGKTVSLLSLILSYQYHRQGGKGKLIYCFPEIDSRVLTNHGLLFLDQIEKRLRAGQEVLYACYDVQSKTLMYSQGRLVEPKEPPTELLDFSSPGEAARWAEGGGPYERAGAPEDNEQSRHLSLRVTPDHRMFVQTGNFNKSKGGVQWSRDASLVVRPYREVSAIDLLSECACPSPAKGKADCTHRRTNVRMLACAEAGYVPQSTTQLQRVQRRLCLSDAQFPAFIELFGFWLRDGTMQYRTRAGGYDSVCFAQAKETDRAWLEAMLPKVGLAKTQYRIVTGEVQEWLLITDRVWFDFFNEEFGGKYQASQYYQLGSAMTPPSSAAVTPPSAARSLRSTLVSSASSASAEASASAMDIDEKKSMKDEEDDPTVKDEEDDVDEKKVPVSPPAGPDDDGMPALEPPTPQDDDDDEKKSPPSPLPQPPQPPQPVVPLPPGVGGNPTLSEKTKLVKHFPAWAMQELSGPEMRLLIKGLHRADGSLAAHQNAIYTPSERFRDQLMQALLHCGYSPFPGLMYPEGTIRGYNWHEQFKVKGNLAAKTVQELSPEEQANYCPIQATDDAWRVTWTSVDGDGPGKGGCWPSMPRQRGITRVPYDKDRDGRVWCVEIKHKDHLIIAQRALRDAEGKVRKQSRPIIVGNCTRTVQEMDKVVEELRRVMRYREQTILDNVKLAVRQQQQQGEESKGEEEQKQQQRQGQQQAADAQRMDVDLSAATSADARYASLPLSVRDPRILGVCLSSRRNMCIHSEVSSFDNRNKVDALCRNLTASFIREQHAQGAGVPICEFYEGWEKEGKESSLLGVYSLADLKVLGSERGWCPYFYARYAIQLANVVVFNYQYMLDPKISGLVSREMEKESIVVFDEAHNIDNICIEALSVQLDARTVNAAAGNLSTLTRAVKDMEKTDAARLQQEYNNLLRGLTGGAGRGGGAGGGGGAHAAAAAADAAADDPSSSSSSSSASSPADALMASPVLPSDVLREAVPGNIRRAKHFLLFLRSWVEYVKQRLLLSQVSQETPSAFLADVQTATQLQDTKALRFAFDRLQSLFLTLKLTDLDDYTPLQLLSNFATVVATYSEGFMVLFEPFDERNPAIPDPKLELCCVAAGTLVDLADGSSVPIEQVQVGAEVLSYHAALAPGETEGLTVRQVDAMLDQGHRECVELLFSDKRTLVCTPDHRIRTADGRWVEAKDLLVGADEVAVGVEYPNAAAVVEGDDEDTDVYRSMSEVTYGVHLQAKMLPLFQVQLVGRREVGVRHVYDLSVPSPQGDVSRSFVANGVVVHNCLDASLAMKPVFERFHSVVITSGTLSPLDVYPRVLNFHPSVQESFAMSLSRNVICLTGDHRVLTRRGWRSITRMQLGDVVLSFNVDTYEMEWKPVLAVTSHAVDPRSSADTLYRMQSSGMDVIATQNHQMLLARISDGTEGGLQERQPVGYETVGDLLLLPPHSRSLRAVVCAGVNAQADVRVHIPGLQRVCDWWWERDRQVSFLKFLGFWLGDGHLHTERDLVCLHQQKEGAAEWFVPLLDVVFPRWWHRVDCEVARGTRATYQIRCPPLYDYLRLMAVGPIGFNPRDPAEVRVYPHFTEDAGLAAEERQSAYYTSTSGSGSTTKWTEDVMLAVMRGDGVVVVAMDDTAGRRSSLSATTSASSAPASATSTHRRSSSSASYSCGGAYIEPEDVWEVSSCLLGGEQDCMVGVMSGRWHCTDCSGERAHRGADGDEEQVGEKLKESGDPLEMKMEEPLVPAVTDAEPVQAMQVAGYAIDGHWFYLKRWLGEQNVADVYSHLSRRQAIALLDGACRAHGLWKSIQYDGSGQPTGCWRCSHSSFPLIDHLQLIGQLAGAAVVLHLVNEAGTIQTIEDRPAPFTVHHWALCFAFTEPTGGIPFQTAPFAQPVDVSKSVVGRGYYDYEDDGRVWCISVDSNTNFLTQRLSKQRIDGRHIGVRAQSLYVSNCPLIVTKGSDQVPITSKFDLRSDLSVIHNYGRLLVELCSVVPDGVVGFFTSYRYMEDIVAAWKELGVIEQLLQLKLIFIETKDIVETTLALDSYKRACECGRGALFLSVARGKVAEGIDFDRHFGRCVVIFGIPFQYTLSRVLRCRLEYLRQHFQLSEADFLSFDALRQTAQCVGRVIRSKTDYGLMIFADQRFNRVDKRNKLPRWITQFMDKAHLNLSTDRAITIAREFLKAMAQPRSKSDEVGITMLSEQQVRERVARMQAQTAMEEAQNGGAQREGGGEGGRRGAAAAVTTQQLRRMNVS